MRNELIHHQPPSNKFYISILHSSCSYFVCLVKGLPQRPSSKEFTCNLGDVGSIPWSGRSPGRKHGNTFQLSCWENPMDRVVSCNPWGCKESDMTEATEHTHISLVKILTSLLFLSIAVDSMLLSRKPNAYYAQISMQTQMCCIHNLYSPPLRWY